MAMWGESSGRPFIITEFYAKGEDSKMPNVGGAGFVVKTQQDRGQFFQNFVLGLLLEPHCVGYHWFKYIDDDPDDQKKLQRMSNKGVLNSRYEPYKPLIDAQRLINSQGYAVLSHVERVAMESHRKTTHGSSEDGTCSLFCQQQPYFQCSML
mmetsp:Transcript_2440/g.3512  ORF Transcript_2440/g.3512 Transcript_2440/m.3512 type:complete len:152 (+) Transcript_2440:915-1370(+)